MGGADISRLLNRSLGDAKEGRQATGGPGRLVSLPPDLGPPRAEPCHREAWRGLAPRSQEEPWGQVRWLHKNLTEEVVWSSSGEGGSLSAATLFLPPTHPQTPGPGGNSAGCSGLAGVEPPQLAEAGQPESE